jgi:sarcosine oxidase, subunit beta
VTRNYQIIICGAGIAGVSAAYYLAQAGVRDILILDDRPPLTLTSDRSTECYRNWWPDPEMLKLMNRSIDLMEHLAMETGNVFRMNRRGYLYVTADESKIPVMKDRAKRISELGGGAFRIHGTIDSDYRSPTSDEFHGQPDGADLLLGPDLILKYFPYLTDLSVAALHVRRAGWLSAQQMGMVLFESACRLGAQFEIAHVNAVDVSNNHVVGIKLISGEQIGCQIFINAAGPYVKDVGKMMGIDIPVFTELHLKVAFKDIFGVVGRNAPLLIWDDTQSLPWDDKELTLLKNDQDSLWLTKPFPSGAHTRPEGSNDSQTILMLWEYKTQLMEPVFPPPLDEFYSEIALRGLSTMLPRLREYFGRAPRPVIDGGYYVKTRENRLLAGPLPVDGAYVIGAVSGYGIMSACAAGELVASSVLGKSLPSYAPAFSLARYEDPGYLKKLADLGESGQL